MDGNIVALSDVDEVGPVVLIGQQFLVIEDAHQPPVVAPPIDLASPTQSYVVAPIAVYEVVVPTATPGPVHDRLRRSHAPLDDEADVPDVVHLDRHEVEGPLWHFHHSLLG